MTIGTYTAVDFIAKLRQGEFVSDPLAVTGLVKLPEEGDGLLFAYGTDCTNWISIPLKLIKGVEFLRVARCEDHNHPLVTLIFSTPESLEAQVFARIAKLTSTPQPNPQAPHPVAALSAPIAVHPLKPQAISTAFDMINPSAHALLQATGAGMPPNCPPGQRAVKVGDQWHCVPI
jgi:hypothetical protein